MLTRGTTRAAWPTWGPSGMNSNQILNTSTGRIHRRIGILLEILLVAEQVPKVNGAAGGQRAWRAHSTGTARGLSIARANATAFCVLQTQTRRRDSAGARVGARPRTAPWAGVREERCVLRLCRRLVRCGTATCQLGRERLGSICLLLQWSGTHTSLRHGKGGTTVGKELREILWYIDMILLLLIAPCEDVCRWYKTIPNSPKKVW